MLLLLILRELVSFCVIKINIRQIKYKNLQNLSEGFLFVPERLYPFDYQ